jgi:transposase
MSTKKHTFWIYNEKSRTPSPYIDADGEDRAKPTIEDSLGNAEKIATIPIQKGKNFKWRLRMSEIRLMVAQGKSDREIAKILGVPRRALEKARQRYGILKQNHRKHKHKYFKWKGKKTHLRELVRQGQSDKQIAKLFGTTKISVSKARERLDILKKESKPLKPKMRKLKNEMPKVKVGDTLRIRIEPKEQVDLGDLGVFIHCLTCGLDYLEEKNSIIQSGETVCPSCKHKIKVGGGQ